MATLGVPAVAQDRPNVWLIILDDMDPDHWDCPAAVHPNLDRIRAEGVYFPNGYTGQVCRPGHASILTGKTPRNHGRLNNRTPGVLAPDGTIGVLHHDAGYATYFGGKLWEGPPESFGFDVVEGYSEPGHGKGQAGLVRDGQDVFLDFVQAAAEPWIAYYAPALPHLPANAPQEFWDMIDPSEIVVPDWIYPSQVENYVFQTHGYLANLAWLDSAIGEGLSTLESCGRLDNTLIVVVADNAWGIGYVGKQSPFEHGIRTPLLFRGAGLAPGERSDLVSSVDILPTLCRFAGISAPAGLDGRNLTTTLRGDAGRLLPRASLVGENWSSYVYEGDTGTNTLVATWVRQGRWKYIRWSAPIGFEQQQYLAWYVLNFVAMPERVAGDEDLYDLWSDPGERNDVAASPQYAGVLQRLRREAAMNVR